jgi:hypothetical protein
VVVVMVVGQVTVVVVVIIVGVWSPSLAVVAASCPHP